MKIVIGQGSCGLAAGGAALYTALEEAARAQGLSAHLAITGCIGMCYLEPIVEVYEKDTRRTFVRVQPTDAQELIAALKTGGGEVLTRLSIAAEDVAVLEKQTRIALRNCGNINPEVLGEYTATGGYEGLRRALTIGPEAVIAEIKVSGLAGRGGAGFPTWFKWQAARDAQGETKYLICNADEGDPGAFMDRAVIEGDPHALIEGMLIGAFAIGARETVVYVRAEYPLAILRLQRAMEDAAAAGILGEQIFGSDFSCTMRIKAGAGAFVCGEETALIESLEGERGMPRLKPPFPAQKGFWQNPSNINNVETLANVPWIIQNGGAAFAQMGTEGSKGTKVFALTGKIKKGGLVEIPMGKTLREVIYDIGGGIRNDRKFKAVQMGGPSGGCIPEGHLDKPIDYKEIMSTGAIMGSGGMVVMDETTCMVDQARFFLDFTARESCGKCIHCRIGTTRLLEILTDITQGKGREGDIEKLEQLCLDIKDGSLCGLGQSAPNPVLTTIRYFREEYEAHIRDHKCPAKQCKPLLSYTIDPVACKGCTLCLKGCPTKAITGAVKEIHVIDPAACIQCGKCVTACKFHAVLVD